MSAARLLHRRDQQHVRTLLPWPHRKVRIDIFLQHRRCERPERLAELDLQVHHRLHPRAAGIAQNAPRAQRPWPELHPPLKPAHHLLLRQQSGHEIAQRFIIRQLAIHGSRPIQERADFCIRKSRSEKRPVLAVTLARLPRLIQKLMPNERRHAERPARVARRRLNPQFLERSLRQNPSIADAIERHAARQAELLHSRLCDEHAAPSAA